VGRKTHRIPRTISPAPARKQAPRGFSPEVGFAVKYANPSVVATITRVAHIIAAATGFFIRAFTFPPPFVPKMGLGGYEIIFKYKLFVNSWFGNNNSNGSKIKAIFK
jgi:hypothetical protein